MSNSFWLASYPKSGNTWFRIFLGNYLQDSIEPLNINSLKDGPIASYRRLIDEILGFDTSDMTCEEIERIRPFVYDWSKTGGEPQFLKIHDAFTQTDEGLPLVGTKFARDVLYIIRNPLDVASSLANHKNCTIDEAIDFMAASDHKLARQTDRLLSQIPQFTGTWSDHVSGWVKSDLLRCHVLRFEDMKSTPELSFETALSFLELPINRTCLKKAIYFSSFKELSEQELKYGFSERPTKSQKFFRQGETGGWRQELSDAQVSKIVDDHSSVMIDFGYIDQSGQPL